MQVQPALFGTPTAVTLLKVELCWCLDLLPGASTVERHFGLHCRLDLSWEQYQAW
jgi:hypothetical protein